MGSFSYTSRAAFNFMRGASLTHCVLDSLCMHYVSLTNPVPTFFFSFSKRGVSLTLPMLVSLFITGVSLTHPELVSFSSRKFLLHILCWLHFYFGSFSYTSRAGYNFIRGLTYPMLSSFDISRAGLIIMAGVSLTHPMLTLFLCGEFVLDILCCLHFYAGSFSYTSRAGFHTFLFLFFKSGEFLLHIPCWLHFYLGSVSYTSRAGFIFIWEVSLTHPVLASFLSGKFLLHIPFWFHF